MIKLLSIPL